ncbi:hypothetical protein GCM10011608_09810 [Micromonospora sonchi]|uniref:Uncharacterized protein n=1 Tax=Micromonospora sonchi TaxID=1763543 RepID=A0A917TL08_9ACTN|nr:hypothetical protein [Micromonospora sonchi]GGM27059.1 hypothetical protein GCM10011608_09810 [Micromonospora sonchi]
MGKLSDELDDLNRRYTGVRDAIDGSHTSTIQAVDLADSEVQALRDGDLSDEQRRHVDRLTELLGEIRTAADGVGDGYKAPTREPAPVKGQKGKPAPGSVADRERGGI